MNVISANNNIVGKTRVYEIHFDAKSKECIFVLYHYSFSAGLALNIEQNTSGENGYYSVEVVSYLKVVVMYSSR